MGSIGQCAAVDCKGHYAVSAWSSDRLNSCEKQVVAIIYIPFPIQFSGDRSWDATKPSEFFMYCGAKK